MILTARVYDAAIQTPLTKAVNLSNRQGNDFYLKREDLQPVFSFKIRGAYNKMYHLTAAEKARGVVACSAGNHAQGVALSAQKLGIQATIIMPTATPEIKWRNVKRLGAEVVLFGSTFDEAREECTRLSQLHGWVNIPPYDDPYVIAGQGTVGFEILREIDTDKLDAVFIAVGGGGLAAGVGTYIKRIRPDIKVIGVETHDADAMTQSLRDGHRHRLSEVGLFADGTAVSIVGQETFRVCREVIDDMILIDNDEICAAIKDVFEDTRSILEPSGALSLAGAKQYCQLKGWQGKTVVAITSGANMNFDRLRFVAERAAIGEGKEVLMSVLIPERPGSFLKLHDTIFPRNITEFSYRYSDPEKAYIYMSFNVQHREAEVPAILGQLSTLGMEATDISDNEMAKSHARYLAGGRCQQANEHLVRFQFPERPGALKLFLNSLASSWNISLFHYRNFGSDVGKVLVGIQVPPTASLSPDGQQPSEFQKFLDSLNYPYVDETNNPVYQQFLK
ncbi:tryptophan synthase beta subunit-like PLP-dependent enzyme [Dimargaris cristalligena]|uniref:Threonine dehydratase n=1 Tax=Dimargaris cristalligena TaxID=215637 RepID=A0A4P9ZN10_9FUNG|nr:tryptophan synthase beta subunit-like PLP-dependent enzyme [Dimargaris cristalligena]|eukprot:RKP34784.1 tryptophan synthase beta subunit-like PLP-dependent enzyme [Dimargaris cristalligena]